MSSVVKWTNKVSEGAVYRVWHYHFGIDLIVTRSLELHVVTARCRSLWSFAMRFIPSPGVPSSLLISPHGTVEGFVTAISSHRGHDMFLWFRLILFHVIWCYLIVSCFGIATLQNEMCRSVNLPSMESVPVMPSAEESKGDGRMKKSTLFINKFNKDIIKIS